MNQQNPLTLPPSINNTQSGIPGDQHAFESETPEPESARLRQQNTGRKPPRPSRKRRRSKFRIEQLKTWFKAKLDALDSSTLKLILIACGITTAAALAVIALIKFLPLGIALLALLGLGALLSLWDRLRYIIIYPRA
jgi:hypothetical protein